MGGGKKPDTSSFGQAASDIKQASAQTQAESSQYSGSFDIGKLLQQIYQSQMGIGSAPAGYQNADQQFQNQGYLEQGIYNTALQGIQNPDQQFMSTLQPQLDQAQSAINSYYQKRGLINSGLAIGQMGQAGVDLSIQQAQAMMQNRQQQYQNALGLSQYAQGVGQQNLNNLQNLYGQQQQFGEESLNRQANGALQAAQYQTYPAQAALGNYYGSGGNAAGIGMLGAGAGALVGGLLAAPTGGMSIPMGAAIGAGIGGGGGALLSMNR